MKKLITNFVFLAVLFINSLTVFAAGDITVTLNGAILNYSLVPPQMVNSRTMVPIRETAEYLGMSVDWNNETNTMICTGGGRAITHTLNQNIIFIDGMLSVFDTPSQVIDNRSVMPVRMLAEAIGAAVEWDANSRTVIITKADETPAISNVSASSTSVLAGETIYFTVSTNATTDKLRLFNITTGELISDSANASLTDTGKAFIIEFTPDGKNAELNLNFIPLKADNSAGAPKQLSIYITNPASLSAAKIVSLSSASNTIKPGESVKITVTTNESTDGVYIYEGNSLLGSKSAYSTNSDGSRVFTITVTPAANSGTATLTIAAADKYGYEVKENLDIKVSAASSNYLSISSVDIDDDIYYDSLVYASVYTDDSAVRVWVEYDGKELDYTKSYDKYNNEYVWELAFYFEESGSYYFYAENADGDSVYKRYSLSASTSSTSSSYSGDIYSAQTNYSTYTYGEKVIVTALTEYGAKYVWIEYGGSELDYTSSYTASGSYREWELSFYIQYNGTYYIYSENADGDIDSYSLYIYLSE